jgi:serine/threonine protein kinase
MDIALKTVSKIFDTNCIFTQLITLEDLTSFCILLILFPQIQSVCLVCYSLSSAFPFGIRDNVKRDVKFPQPCWSSISSTVTDLIKSMLKHHPKERTDLNMILSHPWLKVWTAHCYSYYKCKWIVQNKYKIISMLNKNYISKVHGELLRSCVTLTLVYLFNNGVICIVSFG